MIPNLAGWYHDNRYHARIACRHCAGVVRHEVWCTSLNSLVRYAFQIVVESSMMTTGDVLILHALGVKWTDHDRVAHVSGTATLADCI